MAPSGTCFARLREDETYRRAVLAADLAIADSGLMVGLWRLLQREKVQRISGFKYLKHLLRNLKGEGNREVFWVLPTERARQNLFDWSRREAFSINRENCYVAPRYGSDVEDRDLLALIEQHRAGACDHRDRQRRTGEARILFARKSVVSAGDPLHRRGARIHHRRPDCNSRLGGPALSRLALAIGCAAEHLHSATVPRMRTSVVDLEIWREIAAAARPGVSKAVSHGPDITSGNQNQRTNETR